MNIYEKFDILSTNYGEREAFEIIVSSLGWTAFSELIEAFQDFDDSPDCKVLKRNTEELMTWFLSSSSAIDAIEFWEFREDLDSVLEHELIEFSEREDAI